MFTYPNINPIVFQIGYIKVHWYGLLYLFSFLIGWRLLIYRAKLLNTDKLSFTAVSDIIFYSALGVIFGGRCGYMLFYDFSNFIHQPWIIFKLWEGGMSFHGGLIGVIIALALWCRKNHRHLFDITDFIAPIVPIGLAAGRLGNFINGELWGKVTTMPWGMVYPYLGQQPRHPSEIYELLLEGILLFTILWFYSRKPRPRFAVSAVFLLGYGLIRCFCEFFRQPDPQWGYLAFGWLTMGQILSIPMIAAGIAGLIWAYQRHKRI